MKHLLVSLALVFLLAAALHGAGCSAAGNDQVAAGSGGGAGASGTGAGGSSLTITGAGGGASCSGNHCSSDLHSLVDCDGKVIITCPSDQGCTPTGCVEACDAAKANKSSVGCDYYAVNPDAIFGRAAPASPPSSPTRGPPPSRSGRLPRRDARPLHLRPSSRAAPASRLTYAPLSNAQSRPGRSPSSSSRRRGPLEHGPAAVPGRRDAPRSVEGRRAARHGARRARSTSPRAPR